MGECHSVYLKKEVVNCKLLYVNHVFSKSTFINNYEFCWVLLDCGEDMIPILHGSKLSKLLEGTREKRKNTRMEVYGCASRDRGLGGPCFTGNQIAAQLHSLAEAF